jgi:Restriction alleviation protein Lar
MSGDVKPGTALEACPFCGASGAYPQKHFWHTVVCRGCNAEGPAVKEDEDGPPEATEILEGRAITAWNTRTPDPALLARIEVLEGAMVRIQAQAVCVIFPASLEERCDWLVNIANITDEVLAPKPADAASHD